MGHLGSLLMTVAYYLQAAGFVFFIILLVAIALIGCATIVRLIMAGINVMVAASHAQKEQMGGAHHRSLRHIRTANHRSPD